MVKQKRRSKSKYNKKSKKRSYQKKSSSRSKKKMKRYSKKKRVKHNRKHYKSNKRKGRKMRGGNKPLMGHAFTNVPLNTNQAYPDPVNTSTGNLGGDHTFHNSNLLGHQDGGGLFTGLKNVTSAFGLGDVWKGYYDTKTALGNVVNTARGEKHKYNSNTLNHPRALNSMNKYDHIPDVKGMMEEAGNEVDSVVATSGSGSSGSQ